MSLAHRQIVYSASVTISRAYGCQGNCDITADIVMHENSNSRGAVARRPELREVMGQRAKLIVVLWTQSAWVARCGSISLLLAQTRLITTGGDKIDYCAFVNQKWENTFPEHICCWRPCKVKFRSLLCVDLTYFLLELKVWTGHLWKRVFHAFLL